MYHMKNTIFQSGGTTIPVLFNTQLVKKFFHQAPSGKSRLQQVGAHEQRKP